MKTSSASETYLKSPSGSHDYLKSSKYFSADKTYNDVTSNMRFSKSKEGFYKSDNYY
jgi:hypothetical protein